MREHAGDKEAAWADAGKQPGTEIWRVEQFKLHTWPKDKFGQFYDGDSYIVLHVRPQASTYCCIPNMTCPTDVQERPKV